jgi:hypothetical protein
MRIVREKWRARKNSKSDNYSQLHLRIPPDIASDFKSACAANGKRKQQVLLEFIQEYVASTKERTANAVSGIGDISDIGGSGSADKGELVGTRRCVGCGAQRDVYESEVSALGIRESAGYMRKMEEVTNREGWFSEQDPFGGAWTVYCPDCLSDPSRRTFPDRGNW